MTRRLSFLLLTIAALFTAINFVYQAQAQAPALLTRHTREVVTSGQVPMAGRLPADQTMRLTLVLPLRNRAGLDSFLKDVYNPHSPSFRHFLTVEQFTAKFGPTKDDYNTVMEYARSAGFQVVATSRNRVNLDVTGSVVTIEKAFHVTMGLYQHPTENRTFHAPDREPTPDLSVQLWRISGLDNYSIPKPQFVRRDAHQAETARPNATIGSCPQRVFLRQRYARGLLRRHRS